MNLADILKLAGLAQQDPMSSLSSPGSSCNQHMNPDDMRTLVIKIEQPQLQPEQEMVATEEAEGSYANAPEEKEVGDTHNDFSFKGFGKRKRHTRDALGNYGDNPLEESQLIAEYKNFKETDAYNDPDAWKDLLELKGVHRKTTAPKLPDKIKRPPAAEPEMQLPDYISSKPPKVPSPKPYPPKVPSPKPYPLPKPLPEPPKTPKAPSPKPKPKQPDHRRAYPGKGKTSRRVGRTVMTSNGAIDFNNSP